MVNIEIKDCTFTGNAQAIHSVYEISNKDFSQIEKELSKIKETLKQGTLQYNAVTELQNNVAQRDINAINSSIKQFGSQFSSATLANLAGACLCRLFGL